jgi:hypothetical protein
MITVDEVRRLALALPETAEHTHYRLPAFEVGGRNFAVVKPGQARALLHIDEAAARDVIAEDPTIFEAERPGRPFGVWVDLGAVAPDRFERLLEQAYRSQLGR